MTAQWPDTIHATCVAWYGRGVLITGASGAGKSSLGLVLMAMGCSLVADDRVRIRRDDERLIATSPPSIVGRIEARGIGILDAESQPDAQVALAVDLDHAETARMPQRRILTLLGCDVPLIWRSEGPQFAPAILQSLKAGRSDG